MYYRITIKGKIQGVGFRPFIKNLADSLNLKGEVLNSSLGVQINVEGNLVTVQMFLNQIKEFCPPNAKILDIEISEIEDFRCDTFSISKSILDSEPLLIVSSDQSICFNCKAESLDPNNRRFRYPFISCLNCGPRFSILEKLPYDRISTTLESRKMCQECRKEYNEPGGRREHAQSLTCCECPIELSLWKNGAILEKDDNKIFEFIKTALSDDLIIMIKGVSGFLLCCNANSSQAVQKLRKSKNRKSKPFAVMYPDLENINSKFHISDVEIDQLTSVEAPIVLLLPKIKELAEEINFKLDKVGVFLPNSGLLHIILNDFGQPLVATSGNLSDESICYTNENALKNFSDIADLVVCHKLEINFPQDDSVVQFSPIHHQRIILRRSRGMAPEYIDKPRKKVKDILAFGADLKSTFSIQNAGITYISPHFGDLSKLEVQQRHWLLSERLIKMLKHKPEVVLADSMISYYSSQLAQEYGSNNNLNVHLIQHHEAHFAAVLGEHDLWESKDKILGIIWDGVGLGPDKNIWGGEFFKWSKGRMKHIAQLENKPWILGNKMSKEPRISALSYFGIEKIEEIGFDKKFTKQEWNIYSRLLIKDVLQTSSMGRLFDAVSCILDICDYNDFEGYAATLLEQKARSYSGDRNINHYPVYLENGKLEITTLCSHLIEDKIKKVEASEIAYKFHLSLVQMVKIVALNEKVHHLAFSGGVFQNALLIDLLISELGSNFNLYFHKELSPNDENISFGQIMYFNNVRT